jgi:hypothetical protein
MNFSVRSHLESRRKLILNIQTSSLKYENLSSYYSRLQGRHLYVFTSVLFEII